MRQGKSLTSFWVSDSPLTKVTVKFIFLQKCLEHLTIENFHVDLQGSQKTVHQCIYKFSSIMIINLIYTILCSEPLIVNTYSPNCAFRQDEVWIAFSTVKKSKKRPDTFFFHVGNCSCLQNYCSPPYLLSQRQEQEDRQGQDSSQQLTPSLERLKRLLQKNFPIITKEV